MLFLDAQHARITEALDKGELISGQSLNQEKSLKCAGDTRWDHIMGQFSI